MNLELAAPAHPYQKVQVSLLLSENAHQLAKKNGFDFAQMLLPYSTVQISIKEPLSQQVVQHNLHLDFRDLRRSGFLLSHTVFRFVLQESILESSVQRPEGSSILSSSFYHSFMHWHEPPEHEFLQAYLACIFVVSTADSDPLGKLKELEAEQHKEQHGEVGNPTGARISPAYCVPSKWFFPNILKYYLLVHDNSLQPFDTEKSKELFAAICSRYGPSLCQMICLNSANPANPADAGMPDPWGPILRKDNLGLRAGVDLAKKNLISSGKATKPPTSESQKDLTVFAAPSTIPPVYSAPSLFPESASLSPPPLFTTSATFTVSPNHLPLSPTLGHSSHQTQLDNVLANHQQHQMTYAQIVDDRAVNLENYAPQANSSTENAGQIFEEEEKPETTLHGRWLSAEDRQKLRKFVEDFVREILVPYAEKQLAEQGEIVLNRRSLAKSTFTSMRKWLQNAATTGPAAVSNQQHQQQRVLSISYPAESAESQSRRLADLAFVFGLYQYSNQIYQSLKKDFANDQAWLCHAGCLEMASTSSFLANWQQYSSEQVSANSTMKSSFLAMNRKQYPQRYMDNAVHFYANVCRQPFLALRALINGVQILTQLEMFSEAAEQLIRFNSSCTEIAMDDLFQVVLLEHAARLFAKTGNRRRKTDFYLATAGTRLLKFASEQQQNHNIFTAESLRRCKQLSRRFYEEVMASHSVTDRGWAWAEHYLLCQYITSI